jgi:uncharacterized membrane protein YfcA
MMVYKLTHQPKTHITRLDYLKLSISGVLAFISDTLGIGSFAVNIALAKLFNTFKDEELPAINNGAQVIPGTLESLLFMQMIQVDWLTLVTLVSGTCIGGILGGHIVSRLSKQAIQCAMIICFSLMLGLLLCNQFNLIPVDGTLTALRDWKLVAGFFAMIICGSLTSVGIGLFAMVQGVLFLMGVSPAVAFPIMTTAGAMQQPLTTLVFLKENKIPLKKTLILSLSGCIGVVMATPIVSQLSADWLHRLLILIMLYNLITIGRAYVHTREHKRLRLQFM